MVKMVKMVKIVEMVEMVKKTEMADMKQMYFFVKALLDILHRLFIFLCQPCRVLVTVATRQLLP